MPGEHSIDLGVVDFAAEVFFQGFMQRRNNEHASTHRVFLPRQEERFFLLESHALATPSAVGILCCFLGFTSSATQPSNTGRAQPDGLCSLLPSQPKLTRQHNGKGRPKLGYRLSIFDLLLSMREHSRRGLY